MIDLHCLFILIKCEKVEISKSNMCLILEKIKMKTPEFLIKEYYGKNTVSIDIVELAQNIGINLSGVDFTEMEQSDLFKKEVLKCGNILGTVYVENDDVTISYSNKLSSNKLLKKLTDAERVDKLKKRQRFTIAHEIAHCVLHMSNENGYHIEYRTEQSNYIDQKEYDANIYAGKLLMPTDTVKLVAELFNNKLSLYKLSELFQVSKHVVKARLEYMMTNNDLQNAIIIED